MLTLLVLLAVGLPAIYFAARRFERAVVFHPERAPRGGTWAAPEGGEDVWLKTADGVRLHGWFFRARRQPASATVIYFHGNGGNISYLDWLAADLARRGFDVLLFDYRGYGQSEGSVSDEKGIYADSDAAYEYVVSTRGADPRRLVLYGQSLGTTAAADVASRRPCAALVLESGLSSAGDMAALILPSVPRFLHRLARNRFDSARKLERVSCPVLVAHGARDEVIPVEQGRALYDAAREPKELIVLPGAGHNDMIAAGGAAYLDRVADFVRRVTREGAGGAGANLAPASGATAATPAP